MSNQVVDFGTPQGANLFLRLKGGPNFTWFSQHFGKPTLKRLSGGTLTEAEEKEVMRIQKLTFPLSMHSDPVLFREQVPTRELQVWLEYCIAALKQNTTNPDWIHHGILKDHDEYLLRSGNPLFNHVVPLNMALESDYLEALTAFLQARKGDLPAKIADDTVWLVNCVMTTCTLKMDHPWGLTRVYQKLESKGILKQLFRCVCVPLVHSHCESMLLEILKGLLNLTTMAFVKKKFREGTACGEIVRALLDEGSYNKIRPHITPYLQLLVKISSTQKPETSKICQFCCIVDDSEEYQRKMKECSNCGTYYCSKQCQKADWKKHKKGCNAWTTLEGKNEDVVRGMCVDFCHDHYFDIMIKMVQECDKAALEKKDMMLEISFVPDSNGCIPALQDPPQFQIIPARSYIDGSRFRQPDWTHGNKEEYVALTKRMHSNILATGLPIVSVYVWGPFWFGYHLKGGQYDNHIFTQESVDAFQSAMKDKDFAPLIKLFGATFVMQFRMYLITAYPEFTFAA